MFVRGVGGGVLFPTPITTPHSLPPLKVNSWNDLHVGIVGVLEREDPYLVPISCPMRTEKALRSLAFWDLSHYPSWPLTLGLGGDLASWSERRAGTPATQVRTPTFGCNSPAASNMLRRRCCAIYTPMYVISLIYIIEGWGGGVAELLWGQEEKKWQKNVGLKGWFSSFVFHLQKTTVRWQ
jgi:hypothetical protein